MEIVKFDEMKKTWHQIARNNDGSIAPNFELEVYKKMLHVFHPGDFNYYIVNIASVEMECHVLKKVYTFYINTKIRLQFKYNPKIDLQSPFFCNNFSIYNLPF